LPSLDEWKELIDFAGGEKIAGKKLRSEEAGGEDAFGFSADDKRSWWTSTMTGAGTNDYSIVTNNKQDYGDAIPLGGSSYGGLNSVASCYIRCVKD